MSARPLRPGLSRRAFGATVATATFALIAACGSDSDDSGSTGAGSGEGTAAGSDAFPVSIEHKFGTAEIPAKPTKVVVVGLVEQDALLALGTVPIATTKWFGENEGAIWPWAKDKLGSGAVPELLDSTDGIQFEKIAALQPDLIVGMYSGVTQEDYDKLAQIAPTVLAPKDTNDYAVAWDVITPTIGRALGLEAEAQKLVDEVNARFETARADNPGFAGQTALMATLYEGYYVYAEEDPRGQFLKSLGFSLPDGLAEAVGEEFGASISKERIDLLDTDALVWLVPDPVKDKAGLEADGLYNKLAVNTEGRAVYLSDGTEGGAPLSDLGAATSFVTVLSLPFLIENLVPLIAQAADGDPATAVEDESA
ncbi:iron-siderophore ABC transporter substrate-binding protein [Kineosporia rhizophila]|uniref:iron-siderophore ABC transporter substrate-binding protein n=1 Tax=Kineosporia TaxID=49184 RepID=UPI001E2CD94B|nr:MULTISPECIES: iron-siderophore ABC transporter substrate-binding protein [Kineosporia]MCE0535668.1 iron-siderophore ABC transporter substrate-binding protein [Kineosporia rhizophila]GLY17687.1 ABC transporter substrate-binding protein [Kineosporia sp. NBRC 101677]